MVKKPIHAKPSAVSTIQAVKSSHAKKGVTLQPSAPKTKFAATSSKSAQVLTLLKRSDGASLDELMKATHWQSHSVRGFLSGAVRKRMGLTLVSEVSEQGLRRYRITGRVGA